MYSVNQRLDKMGIDETGQDHTGTISHSVSV